MTESYIKAQRERRDLNMKLKIIAREERNMLYNMKTTKRDITGGLLDLQTKTKGLNDTLSFIAGELQKRKHDTELELRRMASDTNHGRPSEGPDEAPDLRFKLEVQNKKLDWLKPKEKKVRQNLKVLDMISNKKTGFRGMLEKIRAKKAQQHSEEDQAEEKKEDDTNEICGLINHFLKLPKIYPTKPKKKKPEQSKEMLTKYEERKAEQEKCMSFATRKRVKRCEGLYNTLRDLYVKSGRVGKPRSRIPAIGQSS